MVILPMPNLSGPSSVRFLILLVTLVSWELVMPSLASTSLFTKPSEVLQSAIGLFSSGSVFPHLAVTLYEVLAGSLLGFSTAIVYGLIVGRRRLTDVLEPFVSTLYAVPKILLFPIFVLWFGALAVESKIFFGAFAGFFPVATNITASMTEIKPQHLALARSLGASRIQTYVTIILPSILPSLFSGLRLGMVLTLTAVLMAELIVAEKGIGLLISSASGSLQISQMLALLLIISIISIFINQVLLIIEKRSLRWSQGGT